jgi:hypothetical protein
MHYFCHLCSTLNDSFRGRRDHLVVVFTTIYIQSVAFTCEFESRSGEVYSIQHYVIKFVSALQKVSGFLWVLRFPPRYN